MALTLLGKRPLLKGQKEDLKEKLNKKSMAYKNILQNPEFENRLNQLKESIKSYLNEINYNLEDLEINEIIGWQDWGGQKNIYVTEKCPENIKNVIADLIKKEFPYTN